MATSMEPVGRGQSPASTVEDVGRANAASVLSAVLANGPIARAEIAQQVGLTRATVTRVANRLIDLGLLVETAPRHDNPGRPLIPLALAGADRTVIAVHLGVVEYRVGLVDLQGHVILESRGAYPGTDPKHVADLISHDVLRIASEQHLSRRILGLGVGVAGWVYPESEDIARFEPLGWENVPFAKLLADSTRLPVYLDQFVRGLVRAERMYGTARDLEDVLLLWIGNIIQAALVYHDDIRRGPDGTGGTISHFPVRGESHKLCACGRLGCLACTATDGAMLEEAVRRNLVPPEASFHDLIKLADVSWMGVGPFLSEIAAQTGEAVAAMVDLTNPSAVLVAGLVTTVPTYLSSFQSRLSACTVLNNSLQVRRSGFGDQAPVIGSAAILLGRYFADPFGFENVAI